MNGSKNTWLPRLGKGRKETDLTAQASELPDTRDLTPGTTSSGSEDADCGKREGRLCVRGKKTRFHQALQSVVGPGVWLEVINFPERGAGGATEGKGATGTMVYYGK